MMHDWRYQQCEPCNNNRMHVIDCRVKFGDKSDAGTGGMESKVRSALYALENGSSVVICNGMKYNTIRKVMAGEKVGSFFTKAAGDTIPVEVLAKNGKTLSLLSPSLVSTLNGGSFSSLWQPPSANADADRARQDHLKDRRRTGDQGEADHGGQRHRSHERRKGGHHG
jgi:hypothetical protein